jgi:hypothetical protein
MVNPESIDYVRGRIAYDAYVDKVGGVSAVTGDRLPPFDQTPEPVRRGWIAAALAVTEDVLADRLASGRGPSRGDLDL